MSGGIAIEQWDDGARIILDRPDRGKAIHLPLSPALPDAAIRCDEDDDVRCVFLIGSSCMFRVGWDFQSFVEAGAQSGRPRA